MCVCVCRDGWLISRRLIDQSWREFSAAVSILALYESDCDFLALAKLAAGWILNLMQFYAECKLLH